MKTCSWTPPTILACQCTCISGCFCWKYFRQRQATARNVSAFTGYHKTDTPKLQKVHLVPEKHNHHLHNTDTSIIMSHDKISSTLVSVVKRFDCTFPTFLPPFSKKILPEQKSQLFGFIIIIMSCHASRCVRPPGFTLM